MTSVYIKSVYYSRLWPETAVMDLPCELIHSWPIWEMPFCCNAKGQQKVFAFGSTTVLGLNEPLSRRLIELSTHNTCVESTILLDIQFPLHVVKVLLEFFCAWVTA